MKLFKRHIYILIISLLALTASCEDLAFGDKFLQKPPSGDVTIDTIFSTAEYARRILWYSYSTLPYGLVSSNIYATNTCMYVGNIEGLTDLNQSNIGYDGPGTIYYSGSYNAGSEDGTDSQNGGKYGTKYRFTARKAWNGIRHAWIFIENVDKVPDMSQEEKLRLKAEAKTLIAIYYIEMLRHYGGMPVVSHAITPEETDLPTRSTLQATVDFIVGLLNEAIDCKEFPWALPVGEISNWDGRVTRAAAMGLKLRLLLFVASPLFNSEKPYFDGEASQQKLTWFGDFKQQRWEDAAEAGRLFFEELKRNGYYDLVKGGDYRKAFQDGYYTRGTTETLIATRKAFRAENTVVQAARWGASCPTKEYFDMFPMADGTDFDWNKSEHAQNPFINRDPRLYETILLDGDKFGDHQAAIYQKKADDPINYPQGRDWALPSYLDVAGLYTGFPIRKFVLDRQGEYKQRIVQWPLLRLAEIYLSYAEALNECNRTQDAYPYINYVRNRVGLGDLKSGFGKEPFREAVLRERACEFGWEEVRFFDLIRWKREADFKKPLHGMDLYRNVNTGEYLINIKTLKQRAWQKEGGFSSKWYLSAFPSKEVNKGYGLIQNPGWE